MSIFERIKIATSNELLELVKREDVGSNMRLRTRIVIKMGNTYRPILTQKIGKRSTCCDQKDCQHAGTDAKPLLHR